MNEQPMVRWAWGFRGSSNTRMWGFVLFGRYALTFTIIDPPDDT